jgi:hypothetical protein
MGALCAMPGTAGALSYGAPRRGQGTTTGSVAGGGIYRERVTRETETAAVTSPTK